MANKKIQLFSFYIIRTLNHELLDMTWESQETVEFLSDLQASFAEIFTLCADGFNYSPLRSQCSFYEVYNS